MQTFHVTPDLLEDIFDVMDQHKKGPGEWREKDITLTDLFKSLSRHRWCQYTLKSGRAWTFRKQRMYSARTVFTESIIAAGFTVVEDMSSGRCVERVQFVTEGE